MAHIDKIVEAILNGVNQAQLCANRHLRNECNKKSNVYALPQAVINSIELNLNYALADASSECELYEMDYNKFYAFLKDAAKQSAKIITSTIVSELKPETIGDDNKGLKIWTALYDGKGAEYRKLITYTSRKIYSELITLSETILNEQGSVQTEPLVSAICSVVDSDLLIQPDIELMFSDNGHENRERVMTKLSMTLSPFIEQLVVDENFRNKRLVTTADVIVDAKGLEKIPSECIHSMRLNISFPSVPVNVNTENK